MNLVNQKIEDADMVLVAVGDEFDGEELLSSNLDYAKHCETLSKNHLEWVVPYLNQYYLSKTDILKNALNGLHKCLEGKNYFVLSCSMSGLIENSLLNKERIVAICGSIHENVYDNKPEINEKVFSVIEDCIAVNYQNDSSITRNYDLASDNYAKIIGCASYFGMDSNVINNAKNIYNDNSNQKIASVDLSVLLSDTDISFCFKPESYYYSNNYYLNITGFNYGIENTQIDNIFNISFNSTGDLPNEIIVENGIYVYKKNLPIEDDRFTITVTRHVDNRGLLDSKSEINYFYKMELPSVISNIKKTTEKEFVVSWEHVENSIYNYLDGYDVAYQIDEEEPVLTSVAKDVNAYTFNFDDEFLNKNVKFWVVAKAGDYSFYDNSIAVVSSSYLIGEDGSPSMAEGN